MSKTWKQMERDCAEEIGGKRNPITGRTRPEGESDVENDWLSIECKFRSKPFAREIADAVDQAEQAAAKDNADQIGVVRWHVKNQRKDSDLVFMTWSTFRRLCEEFGTWG